MKNLFMLLHSYFPFSLSSIPYFRSLIIISVIIVSLSAGAQADPGDLLFEFQKPNHAGGDRFGRAMAAIGNNVLISAPLDDTAGFGAGAVYMYNGSGQLLQTFYNPTPYSGPAGSEYFGRALGSLGNSVLVGDPYDSSVAPDGGAVYMFDSITGGLQRTFLNPDPWTTSGGSIEGVEQFGASVAGVGTDKVVIGAWANIVSDKESYGEAYLFSTSTGDLLRTFSSPSPQAYTSFGYAVAAIGNKVAISQPRLDRPDVGIDDSGAVHLFDVVTGDLLHTFV